MELLLVRHGETDANCQGRFQGLKDYPLNDYGIHQAQLASQRLKADKIDAIYTSCLSRARMTAVEISSYHTLTPIVEDNLKEYCWGIIEGLTRTEIKSVHPSLGKNMEENFHRVDIPEEEGLLNLSNRVFELISNLKYLQETDDIKKVILVTHGRLLGALTAYLTDYNIYDTPWPFKFSNASLSVIEMPLKGRAKIKTLNDTCHLNL